MLARRGVVMQTCGGLWLARVFTCEEREVEAESFARSNSEIDSAEFPFCTLHSAFCI
jgi:hypothetical protein